jgi:hypothetical protein
VGDLIIPPRPRFQITKHLNLAVFALGPKIFCGCFEFEALKVELDPQCMGDFIICSRHSYEVLKK